MNREKMNESYFIMLPTDHNIIGLGIIKGVFNVENQTLKYIHDGSVIAEFEGKQAINIWSEYYQYRNKISHLQINDVVIISAMVCRVDASKIVTPNRGRYFVLARKLAYHYLREFTTLSFESIGYSVGRKDHATVMDAITKLTEYHLSDYEIDAVKEFMTEINIRHKKLGLKRYRIINKNHKELLDEQPTI